MKRTFAPFLAFLAVSFIGGGLNGVFVRIVSQEMGSLTGTFLRFFFATGLLLPFWLQRKEPLTRSDLVKFLPFSFNVILFSFAILYTSLTMSNIIYALVPLWVAMLGFFLLGEKLSDQHVWGLLVSLLGMAILVKGSFASGDIRSFGQPLGNLLIVLGVVFWGFWLVAARTLSKKYSITTTLFFSFLITTLVLVPLLPFEGSMRMFQWDITAKGWGSLIGVILFSSVANYFIYQWLIKNTSAFIASFVQYGAVVFGALTGVIVFAEKLTGELVLGGGFVIVGVFLATTYTQLKKRR